jgi:hypothetical protein
VDHYRANGNDEQRRKDEKEYRKHELDAQLRRFFFRLLPALGAQVFGMDPQTLSDAGAEAIRLNQNRSKFLHVRNAGALRKGAQTIRPPLTRPHLETDHPQLIADFGKSGREFFCDLHDRLIQPKPGFYGDGQKIESIRQSFLDPFPAGPDPEFEEFVRKHISAPDSSQSANDDARTFGVPEGEKQHRGASAKNSREHFEAAKNAFGPLRANTGPDEQISKPRLLFAAIRPTDSRQK